MLLKEFLVGGEFGITKPKNGGVNYMSDNQMNYWKS